MKTILICTLLILSILPAALVLAAGDCIWYVSGVSGNGCINLVVEVDGASLKVKDGSTSEYWALQKTYQGEDTIGVTITASYDGPQVFSLTGVSYADNPFQGPPALLPPFTVAGDSIDFKVDLSSLDGLDAATPYLPLMLSLNFSVEDEPGTITITKGTRLVFYPKQIIDVSYIAPDAKARVSISDVDLTPDIAPALQIYGNVSWERVAVANALVTPRSMEKKFLFIPESQSTAGSGVAGVAEFDVVANTAASADYPAFSAGSAAALIGGSGDPAKLEDTIQVAVSSNGKEGVKDGGVISRYYAVVDAVENGVSAKGALGGDYVPVNVGDRFGPGTTLKLVVTMDPSRRLLKPYIKLKFYDNSTGEAEVLINEFTNDPNKSLYVKIGEEGVSGVAPCDIVTDASNFMKDVAQNPIDYARVVVTYGFGKAVTAFTGGAGWVLSKTLGAGTKWLIKKYAGPTGPANQMRTSGMASGPVTMSMGQGAAYQFESIAGTQGIALYNRGADLLLSDGYSTVVIPERSSVFFKPSGAISYPTAIFPNSAIPVPVVLSPAHGGAVDSLYSCLQASFPSSPGAPEPINSSFRARLNGRLVSPFMRVDGELQKAVYCPPEDAPLKEGENIFRAAISTTNRGRSLAESIFTASAAVPVVPGGLRSAAGADYIILLWNRSREKYVAKYQVYRAGSSAGAAVLLGEAANPVYAIPAVDAGAGGYYSVRACDALDRCSAESPRLQADLNPSYAPAVPVLSGISSQIQEDIIVLSVAAGSPAPLAWRLQKATSATGPFIDVAAGGGLIIGDSYTVTEIDQGVPYWFRAVPMGRDLVEGVALNIGPLLLADLPPPKPDGLSVEFAQGVARVEWNPSAAKDLDGYYLYRSIDDGPYERIAGGAPITNSYYNDWVESDHRISWKVAAVDKQNKLSALSDPVYASSWGLGYPGVLPSCTITVDSNPDGLNAPWTLTGPNAVSKSFGDAVVGNLPPGAYTLTWGDYSGWYKPASRTVTLADGESITIAGTYQPRQTPVILGTPTEGTVGRNITINGLHFGSAQGSSYVDFNGTRGTIVSWSDTQIIVKVPYGATSGCLKIVTDYGESGCVAFIVSGMKQSLPFLMLLLKD